MKKRLGTIFKLVFAAMGLALIVWMIAANWHGSIILPMPPVDGENADIRVPVTAIAGEPGQRVYSLAPNPLKLASVSEAQITGEPGAPVRVPGTIETIRSANIAYLLAAWAIVGLIYPIQALRWLWLLRCRGLSVSYGQSLRLTYVGQFFNICMPGSTGGDVVRAYYAAKGSGRRADAVVSVVIDRIAGMLGLVILAALVGLLHGDHPVIRPITATLWVAMAVLAVMAVLYTSPSLRRLLHLRALVNRLPGRNLIRNVDAAIVAYRSHMGVVFRCILVSLPVHLILVIGTATIGFALGLDVPLLELSALIPIAFIAGAVPISPSGLGVMEGTAALLIHGPINQVVGMILVFRMTQITYGLVGAVIMSLSDIHLHPQAQPVAAAHPA